MIQLVKRQESPHSLFALRRARTTSLWRLWRRSLAIRATPAEIEARVDAMRDKRKFAVYVAENESGAVIGWISAFVFIAVESEACGEINGLVVADGARSRGAGKELLQAVEAWARGQGLTSVCGRSNVLRERAHRFYLRHGYEPVKDQRVFSKSWG